MQKRINICPMLEDVDKDQITCEEAVPFNKIKYKNHCCDNYKECQIYKKYAHLRFFEEGYQGSSNKQEGFSNFVDYILRKNGYSV